MTEIETLRWRLEQTENERDRLKRENVQLREKLRTAKTTIYEILVILVPGMCGENEVRAAREKIKEAGGVQAYLGKAIDELIKMDIEIK